MVIKSTSIDKEFAKESLNVSLVILKLMKKPERRIINRFIIWPLWIAFAICYTVFAAIFVIRVRDITVGICLGMVLGVILFTLKFYIANLKAYKSMTTSDIDVELSIDEKEVVHNDLINKRKLSGEWDSFICMRVLKHGMYLIPKSQKGVLIAINIKYYDEVMKFIKENNIDIKVIENGK